MSESINGWTPPLIHDGYARESRIATQTDIDLMQRQLRLMGSFIAAISDAKTEFDNGMESLKHDAR